MTTQRKTLLHIDSSIQGSTSASRAVSAAVVEHLKAADPAITIVTHDLAAAPLPHLSLVAFAGAEAQQVLAEFQAADIVVIGVAMYNFTIPSQLKAWIDRILVAGQTFRYGANGVEGLSGGKRVIIALARGGLYGAGSPAAALEHAETYLRGVLGFIGIADPEFIVAEGLALGEETRQAAVAAALERANAVPLAA
jgi:FMN-dependent NADH-azoreductase